MSAEQLRDSSPETKGASPELTAEQLDNIERLEANQLDREKSLESNEKTSERARVEALKEAMSVERGSAEKQRKEPSSPARRRHGVVSTQEKKTNFKKTMKRIQEDMPPAKRAFSKFIHNPVVEKTSEVVGSTVARPNGILAGAATAFFLVLLVYLVAKHFGYPLSGFEVIGAFIVGWLLGNLYDFFKVMITGKK